MIPEWRSTHQPDSLQARANRRIVCALAVLLISIPSLRAQEITTRAASKPSKRLSIAFLGLENQTGDSELAHWRKGTTLLSGSLHEVKAVRVLSGEAVRYALRQVGLRAGAPIDPNRARLMGGHIEAQRVVWGSYSKKADLWQVRVRVMNVATGAVSLEFSAEAKDWFDLRDRLNEQILAELGITPSPEEEKKAQRRWTQSAEALDWCLRVYLSQEQGKPVSELELEKLCRKAIAADPNCEPAYFDLAGALATQGKLDLAEEAARKALELRPDSARAHYALGWVPLVQAQLNPAEAASWLERAEAQFRQASQLDPDDADCQVDLARVCAMRGRLEEAATVLEKAVLLDRTSATAHASLAILHALRRQGDAALRELQEARRYVPEGGPATNALSAIAAAYERLGRSSEAIEYYERTLPLARDMGANPNTIRLVEKQIELLKSRLTPTFIQASMPKRYAENELDKSLRDKLTEGERALAGNPFSCTDAMTQWAKELTRGADTDLDKAKAIFEELSARPNSGGQARSRIAREVFEAWKQADVRLVCMDHAVLFVALARAVEVNTFFVNVTTLPDGTVVNHACAAVFAGERVLLADPTLRWFGVPHQQYEILDDLQAAAFLCFNNREGDPRDLAACRAGLKLWPDSLQGQLSLASTLRSTGRLEEARQVLAGISEPQTKDYKAATYWGLQGLAAADKHDWKAAEAHLLKAVSLNPGSAPPHFNLGNLYWEQHRLVEARTAFRACLRNDPRPMTASAARHYIAQINEEIGAEAVPDTAEPDPKPQ